MTALVLVLSGCAYGLLAVGIALQQLPWYAPLAAAGAGLAWIVVHAVRPRWPVHDLFFGFALAGACLVARGGTANALVGLAIASLALVAWDLAAMRRTLVALPRATRRLWGRRYAPQSAAVAALGLALGGIGLVVRPRINFPVALVLSLAIVTLLVLALWQSGRFRGEPRPASDDEEGKPTKD